MKIGDGTGMGSMPPSHEGDQAHDLGDSPESPGSDFLNPSSGGGPMQKYPSRTGPVTGGDNPYYGGGGGKKD